MNKVLTVLTLSGILASCAVNHSKSTSEVIQTKTSKMTNKEIVGTFLGAVMKQDTATMRQVANADYIQHNPFVRFITRFERTRNLCRKRENVSRWRFFVYAQ